MTTFDDQQVMQQTVLDDTRHLVEQAVQHDLTRATPCDGWDLAALLSHMVGQNAGFAAAVATGSAPADAYAGPHVTATNAVMLWHDSAADLRAAFEDADPEAKVHLAEFDVEVAAAEALGMQLLDAAVHAWDVATSLGNEYRPAEPVVAVVLGFARMIAARGGTPGVFATPLPEAGDDDWRDALRLLGRDPR
jgi:uncharacterized protein (TIGR03086 family)